MSAISQVAQTIYEQIGGRKFAVMTGAKNFIAGERDLMFRLPGGRGFCKNGINVVRIELLPSDTYKVQFSRIRAGTRKVLSEFSDVYFDQLLEIFRRETGLETRMPKVVMRG